MGYLTISSTFSKNSGEPATSLDPLDINLYLTRQNKNTLVDEVIWDGTQNPDGEIDNMGSYIKLYEVSDDDVVTYNYFARAKYVGAETLDNNWTFGTIAAERVSTVIITNNISWFY